MGGVSNIHLVNWVVDLEVTGGLESPCLVTFKGINSPRKLT